MSSNLKKVRDFEIVSGRKGYNNNALAWKIRSHGRNALTNLE